MLTLDVLIATHTPQGLQRVAAMGLPCIDSVRYVVSWQQHGDAPVPTALAGRPDVVVLRYDGVGLSRNRNNAIRHATADIYLIADDDLTYTAAQLQAVIDTFAAHPDVDYASFRYDGSDKWYPAAPCPLTRALPKGFYQSCIEIAVRRSARTAPLLFNTEFGLGSPGLHAAEDEVFLLTARRMGLNCRYFPITITHHRGPSTGRRPVTDTGVLRAMGAYLQLAYGWQAWPRILLKAARLGRAGLARPAVAAAHMCRGALYARKIKL